MITFAAFFAWFLEFGIETHAAVLAFRRLRGLATFWGFLAFAAAGDVSTLLARVTLGKDAAGWVNWLQLFGQFVFICFLICQICGRLTAERHRGKVMLYAAVLAVAAGTLSTAVFSRGEALKFKILDSVIATAMLLAICLIVALLEGWQRLEAHWKAIAAGILTLVMSYVVCAAVMTFWGPAQHFFPVGGIAARLLWLYAGFKGTLAEARMPLGVRTVSR